MAWALRGLRIVDGAGAARAARGWDGFLSGLEVGVKEAHFVLLLNRQVIPDGLRAVFGVVSVQGAVECASILRNGKRNLGRECYAVRGGGCGLRRPANVR